LENLADLPVEGGVEHREGDLDPPVEVPRHPVGRGQQVFRLPTVLEGVDARVLEITVHDGDGADVLREVRHLRTQAADAADDEIDPHAGRTGRVELLDEASVDQRVHLAADAGGAAASGVLRL